jgi:plasmid stabilization system protein ParE
MVVVWSNKAKVQLRKAIEYVQQDSLQNAEKLRDDIIDLSIKLDKHPAKYPIDKYKQNNDGTYRAFIIHHYRVSYRILKDSIYIVRVRHTSMSPLKY